MLRSAFKLLPIFSIFVLFACSLDDELLNYKNDASSQNILANSNSDKSSSTSILDDLVVDNQNFCDIKYDNIKYVVEKEIYKNESNLNSEYVDLSADSLYNMGFSTKNMLELKVIDANRIQLTNFTPVLFKDIKYQYKLSDGSYEDLFSMNYVLPFYRYTGRILVISEGLNEDTEFIVISEDKNVNKINSIKLNWVIDGFRRYSSGNWEDVSPEIARAYAAIFLNYAYFASTDEYRNMLDGLRYVIDKEGNTISAQQYYDKLLEESHFRLGNVYAAEGTAGGYSTFGIISRKLDQYVRLHYYAFGGIGDTFTHELHHKAPFGYGHEGNITYPDSDTTTSPSSAIGSNFAQRSRTVGYMPYDLTIGQSKGFYRSEEFCEDEKNLEKILSLALSKDTTPRFINLYNQIETQATQNNFAISNFIVADSPLKLPTVEHNLSYPPQ